MKGGNNMKHFLNRVWLWANADIKFNYDPTMSHKVYIFNPLKPFNKMKTIIVIAQDRQKADEQIKKHWPEDNVKFQRVLYNVPTGKVYRYVSANKINNQKPQEHGTRVNA